MPPRPKVKRAESLREGKGKRAAAAASLLDIPEEEGPLAKAPKITVNGTNGVLPRHTKTRQGPSRPALSVSLPVQEKSRSSELDFHSAEHSRRTGQVYTFGEGICGQLGHGPDVTKRNYPCLIEKLKQKKVVQVAAGGMHTTLLDVEGRVWTFGLNDDLALGRLTEEEEDGFEPDLVNLRKKVIQVTAGDSHSAALTEEGDVYAWGTFKDINGNFGLIPNSDEICLMNPQWISAPLNIKITKISSGDNHLVMLSVDGRVFTCGSGEQGQLGRSQVVEQVRVTRASAARVVPPPMNEKDFLLTPMEVKIARKKVKDIWTGSFSTYLQTERYNEIWVFGLNNYFQLGLTNPGNDQVVSQPTRSPGFRGNKWTQIAGGQHHTVALDKDGKVYCLGRGDDGRLGLGEDSTTECSVPTLIPALNELTFTQVSGGLSTSYAISSTGQLFAWGCGVNYQLGTGSQENLFTPRQLDYMVINSTKVNMEGKVVNVSGGGQHVAVVLNRTVVNGSAGPSSMDFE